MPNQEKKRTLDDRERLIYAPFSGVGGIVYDKDAVYIELGGSHSYSHHNENNSSHNPYINSIITSKNTIDSKLTAGKLKIFSTGEDIDSSNIIDENVDEKTENGKNGASKSSKKMLDESEESNEDEYDEDEEFDQDEDENEEDFDDSDEEDDDEDDSDDEEEDGEESSTNKREKFKFDDDDDDDDDEDEEDEEEDEENTAKWKKNLKLKASVNFEQNKKVNWGKLVYEASGSNPFTANTSETNNELFRIKKIDYKSDALTKDNSKHQTFLNEWGLNKEKPQNSDEDEDEDEDDEENPFDKIKDCFVTGKWESDKDAQNLLDDDEDEDVFGDFEDFESGKKFSGKKELNKDEDEDDEDEDFGDDDGDDQEEENGAKGSSKDKKEEKKKRKLKSEMTKSERLMEKKRRLKEKFNEEFDAEKSGDPNENNYLNHLEHLAEQQTSLNRLEFEKMEDRVRVEYEGFRSGMYVRIEIRKMPCEFVKNFDSRFLSIVGSLGVNESNIGYVQVRLKKHRWYRKILKTKDPLIVSLGWRRFQTIPIYFIQDHNMRNRSLKYTPQHMYCHASFWGGIIF